MPASEFSGVRQITAEETVPIRLAILRPGMPQEAAQFPGDHAAGARHFGAFNHGNLTGVVSIFRAPLPEEPGTPNTWQLRGMATLPEVRGLGFGKALVTACVASVNEENGTLLWCNARKIALGFYAKLGWEVLGEEFEVPTAGPHFRMLIHLRSQSLAA